MLKKNGTKKDLAYIADRSIINPVCKGHLVCDEEENLLACGLLGIGKTKITMMPDGSSAEILRLVSDLMPSKEVQEQVTGDNGTLPCIPWLLALPAP